MKCSLSIDSGVLFFAGLVNLVGVLLTWLVHPAFILLCAFVALNMMQAAFTGFCPAALIFRKLGLQPGPAFFK